MKNLFFASALFIAVGASADVIVSGHTTFGCATDQEAMGTPTAAGDIAALETAPATCESFAGKWTGGCFGGRYTYPTNWPTKNGYVVIGPLDAYSNVTAAPLKGVDIFNDQPTSKLDLEIRQTGCQQAVLKTGTTTKTFFFDKRVRMTQTETFRRSCHSDGYSWRRTYNFLHTNIKTSLWKNGGRWFRENDHWSGRDANYGAGFLQTVNRDWSVENGILIVRNSAYTRVSNLDPQGFNWDPGDVGSDVCVFRRVP